MRPHQHTKAKAGIPAGWTDRPKVAQQSTSLASFYSLLHCHYYGCGPTSFFTVVHMPWTALNAMQHGFQILKAFVFYAQQPCSVAAVAVLKSRERRACVQSAEADTHVNVE